jgi:flagellar protein FlgJ
VNQAGIAGLVSLANTPDAIARGRDPAKLRDAAQQFEALLLGQILHSAHQAGSGWLGADSDSSSDCATDFAEQQLATAMAQQGGLGLAKLIAAGLQRESSSKP